MTAELIPAPEVPEPGSHPYLTDFRYDDVAARYQRMADDEKAALDRWEIGARGRVLRSQGRHVVAPAPEPVAVMVPVTVPDHPRPLAAAPHHDPAGHRKPKAGLFRRHAKPEPLRDQPPARTEPVWNGPGTAGRSGTLPPPVPAEAEADTLLPGAIPPVPAEDDPAAAAVQQQSNEALKRAGASPEDLEAIARPGDGRDATEAMTAVPEGPQQGERQ